MTPRLFLARSAAACIAIALLSLYSAASTAGNLSLTIGDIPTMEIVAFKIGATNAGATSGGSGTGKVAYGEFQFMAQESTATPVQFALMNRGRYVPSAILNVRSSDGLRLLSQWTLENVDVGSVGVEAGVLDPKAKTINNFLPPQTTFSLRFTKYCYRVFAVDGTVATLECFDIGANQGV